MDPGWILAAVALATAAVGLGAWISRLMWRFMSRIMQFLDDFYGEPAKPGHPERPGVMLRLERLETSNNDISHQVHLNSGETLRDAVQRTERGVTDLRNEVAAVKVTVNQIAGGGSVGNP